VDKRGYDLTVQTFSGVMSTTGVAGEPPIRCGVSFIGAHDPTDTAQQRRARGILIGTGLQ
jgi:hypothetical protein